VESLIPEGYGRIVTVIVSEAEAQNDAPVGRRVAIAEYGNQGRSWALNCGYQDTSFVPPCDHAYGLTQGME